MPTNRASAALTAGALALAALAAGVAGAAVFGVVRAVVQTPAVADEAGGADAGKFNERMDLALARIDGRSLFFTPPRPRPPAPPPRVEEERPPPPPSKPTRYGGPQVIAIINGVVWFDDGSKLAAASPGEGEDEGGNEDELAVLSIDAPWSVRVRWAGEPWTLDLFERNVLVPMFEPPPEPDPVPEAAEDEPAVPDEVGVDVLEELLGDGEPAPESTPAAEPDGAS